MKHFAVERWVDFSRKLVGPEESSRMREHLEEGCSECKDLAEWTSRLVRCCANMAATKIPESVVRPARAIFPVRSLERRRTGLRLPIQLVFDSYLTPAPAGIRSTWQVGWQGLYHAGECSLDLRIEPDLKSGRAAVIGQVTNRATPEKTMSHLAVALRAGKQVVAETVSNRFGEFQMEYEQQGQLQLIIHLSGGRKVIQVPLKKLLFDQPVAKNRVSSESR